MYYLEIQALFKALCKFKNFTRQAVKFKGFTRQALKIKGFTSKMRVHVIVHIQLSVLFFHLNTNKLDKLHYRTRNISCYRNTELFSWQVDFIRRIYVLAECVTTISTILSKLTRGPVNGSFPSSLEMFRYFLIFLSFY